MAGISRDDLSRRLIESGLMSADTARDALNDLPDDCDAARELVSRKMLTEFQATMLGSGELRTLVLGNYVVQDKLGGGGMGVVFLARHRRMKRVVALKVLSPALTGDDDAVHRFQREVELLSRLHHPNIATAYDADEKDGMHFLAMEYVNGWDLRALVRRDGPLPVARAVNCVRQAAQGLAFVHRNGIIHRDVKPSNLLLDSSGTIKVLDLGLARLLPSVPAHADEITETEITAFGEVMGTAAFMAPEQGIDMASADERSDVYSLGCTLYFALTGQPPVSGDTTMQKILAHQLQQIRPVDHLRPDVPYDVCRVVERMTAKSPDDRFQSMEEVVVALSRLNVEEDAADPSEDTSLDPVLQSPPAVAEDRHTPSLLKRRSTALAAIVLMGILLVVIANPDPEPDDHDTETVTTMSAAAAAGRIPAREYTDITADFGWWDYVEFLDESRAVCGGGYYGVDDAGYPLVLWRLSDGTSIQQFQGPTSWVWCGDVSRDGRYLLAGTGPSPVVENGRRWGGTTSDVFVWDLETGDLLSHFQEHGNTVRAAAFLPNGRAAVSGGYDGTLRLWSIETAEQEHLFDNFSGEVLSVAASPDGRWIASGHWNSVELWNLESLAWERQFQGARVLALAFSDDGRYLAIGGDEGNVRVVDLSSELETPAVVADLTGHQGRVKSLAWLPDGHRLISCSDADLSICLWDLRTEAQIPWFEGADREVKNIDVAHDGRRLLAACADGTIQLWALPPAELIEGGDEE